MFKGKELGRTRMNRLKVWVWFVGLSLSMICAADGVDQLLAFQRSVTTVRAVFHQTVTDENGEAVQESTGVVLLSRPGRFRWSYKEPFEQLVVSDGTTIWFYDADLDQVTVRESDGVVGGTAALLFSRNGDMEKEFVLTPEKGSQGVEWVRARPKEKGSSFGSIRIGFKEGFPAGIELQDNFGQTTQLEFSHVELNPRIGDNRFRFIPPPGVDVLQSGE